MVNYYSLLGGTEIVPHSDLNTMREIGNYYSPLNVISKTLLNCPTNEAFTLKIELSTGNDYIGQTIRIFTTGQQYYRNGGYKADINPTWGDWYTTPVEVVSL